LSPNAQPSALRILHHRSLRYAVFQ
jgi:hypothetical protein